MTLSQVPSGRSIIAYRQPLNHPTTVKQEMTMILTWKTNPSLYFDPVFAPSNFTYIIRGASGFHIRFYLRQMGQILKKKKELMD